jgi:hypothetical protein
MKIAATDDSKEDGNHRVALHTLLGKKNIQTRIVKAGCH